MIVRATPPEGDPEVVARRLAGHNPAQGHDTGGLPWHGRELTDNPFSRDTGIADPRLHDALRLHAGDHELMEALAAARLVVPVVAVASEVSDAAATGLAGDAHSDMATVVLTAPDGERALPVFTGIEALATWNPQARPVPVTAASAAQAAIDEGCAVIVLDLGDAHRRVVRSSQLWALAQERHWHHPAQDDVVRAALRSAADAEPDVVDVVATPGEQGALGVELVLVPGLDPARVQEIATGVGAALGEPEVRIRVDAVSLTVRAR